MLSPSRLTYCLSLKGGALFRLDYCPHKKRHQRALSLSLLPLLHPTEQTWRKKFICKSERALTRN